MKASINFRNGLAAALTVTLLAATPSLAQSDLPNAGDKFTRWGGGDGWNIYIDEKRESCLGERIDANGNVLQMGVSKNKELGYIGVFTQDDLGMADGTEEIKFSIRGHRYSGTANRVGANLKAGYQGGYALANNPNFIEDVMMGEEMIVFPETEKSFVVSLKGTRKAIEAIRQCNAQLMN